MQMCVVQPISKFDIIQGGKHWEQCEKLLQCYHQLSQICLTILSGQECLKMCSWLCTVHTDCIRV